MKDIVIVDKWERIAKDLASLISNLSKSQDIVSISLSGGSSPLKVYQIIAEKYSALVDWNKVYVFWGDERCVAPDSDESNYFNAYNNFLSKVNIPTDNIFRIKGELDPEEACVLYEKTIKENVEIVDGIPRFDIMLLGMGDDGHTASIFPNQICLWDNENLCVVAEHPVSGQKRVSFTGKVINNAVGKYIIVAGASKAECIKQLSNKTAESKLYPVSKVINATWIIDKDLAEIAFHEK